MNIATKLPASSIRRLFLDVERSVCGRAWRDRLDEQGALRALAITQRHDVPELLARILAGRDVAADEVVAFLDPTVRALMPDPDSLADMRTAATRLADAVMRAEVIAIFGDYDVRWCCLSSRAGALSRSLRPAPDHPHSGPVVRRLWTECRSDPSACVARGDPAGGGRLRNDEPCSAFRGAQAWPRCHCHRPSSGR